MSTTSQRPEWTDDELRVLARAGYELRDGRICRRGGPWASMTEVRRILDEHYQRRRPIDLSTLQWHEVDYLASLGYEIDGDRVLGANGLEAGEATLRSLLERANEKLTGSPLHRHVRP